jgi:hypothetical protein
MTRYDVARRAVVAVEGGGATDVEMRYRKERPFDVEFSFASNGDEWVPWTFARTLLVDAQQGRAGIGDVSCWTTPSWFFLRVNSPDGEMTFSCERRVVDRFLGETNEVVPLGAESIDFDAELEWLLMTEDLP